MYETSDAIDCNGPSYATKRTTLHGRRLLYINGNHGQSGVWCFGSPPRNEVTTWDDHTFTAAVEFRIVGSARLAR